MINISNLNEFSNKEQHLRTIILNLNPYIRNLVMELNKLCIKPLHFVDRYGFDIIEPLVTEISDEIVLSRRHSRDIDNNIILDNFNSGSLMDIPNFITFSLLANIIDDVTSDPLVDMITLEKNISSNILYDKMLKVLDTYLLKDRSKNSVSSFANLSKEYNERLSSLFKEYCNLNFFIINDFHLKIKNISNNSYFLLDPLLMNNNILVKFQYMTIKQYCVRN